MIIVDIGVLVAAVNRRDSFHASYAALLDQAQLPLMVPLMVVTKVCYMLARPCRAWKVIAVASRW